jgi:ubiquinone/menaquinone biosynthesis C-methylase UbiE
VGCATGRLLSKLASAGWAHLFGVDLAPNIVDVAAEKLGRQLAQAELRAADAEDSIPWPDRSFDVVTLMGVLHNFYRPDDALREIHRVLRPGGRLLVADPDFFPPLRQLLNLAFRVAPHAGDYRFYSKRSAVGLVERVGFRCLEARRVGLWAYLITAVKPDASGGAA